MALVRSHIGLHKLLRAALINNSRDFSSPLMRDAKCLRHLCFTSSAPQAMESSSLRILVCAFTVYSVTTLRVASYMAVMSSPFKAFSNLRFFFSRA